MRGEMSDIVVGPQRERIKSKKKKPAILYSLPLKSISSSGEASAGERAHEISGIGSVKGKKETRRRSAAMGLFEEAVKCPRSEP